MNAMMMGYVFYQLSYEVKYRQDLVSVNVYGLRYLRHIDIERNRWCSEISTTRTNSQLNWQITGDFGSHCGQANFSGIMQ